MVNFFSKRNLIALIIVLGLALITIFQQGLFQYNLPENRSTDKSASKAKPNPDIPHLVSTKPAGLKEGVIVASDEKIEITFSHPFENRGEVKTTMDPMFEYTLELSNDKKTVKLLPSKPFELGTGYTFTIKQDSKFDGQKRLEHDEVFHFNTITYKGV